MRSTDRYLNICVIDRTNRNGMPGLARYAQLPGDKPLTDGAVIIYQTFCTLEPLYDSYRLGRTANHEIGHWLNLLHFDEEGQFCEVSHGADDSPTALNVYEAEPGSPGQYY